MISPLQGNLLAELAPTLGGERVDVLIDTRDLRLERIVSLAAASAPGFWYDQIRPEWVLLLAGAARLRFVDEAQDRVLGPGDFLYLPAGRRHRVEWTDPDQPTVWLALHHGGDGQGGG